MTLTTADPVEAHVPTRDELDELSNKVGAAMGAIAEAFFAVRKIEEPFTPEQAWHLHTFAVALTDDAAEIQRLAGELDEVVHAGTWDERH